MLHAPQRILLTRRCNSHGDGEGFTDPGFETNLDVATTDTHRSFIRLDGGQHHKRVMLLPNAKQNMEKEPVKLALFTGNYKEQVTSRDAATGRIIAASDFFEPLTPGPIVTPGFGGRIYFPTAKGFVTMQPKPKADASKR